MPKGKHIFYLITILAMIVVFLKFSELRYIVEIFKTSNWHYLGLVLILQFLSFFAQAFNFQAVLKIKNLKLGIWELFPIGYVVQFISQVIPTGGLSGQVFFIYYLKKYGLSFAEGFGRAILEVASLYVAYLAYFIVSTYLLFRSGVFHDEPRLILFIYAFLVFFGIFAIIIILSQKKKRDSRIDWFFDRIARYLKNSSFMQLPGLRSLNNHSEHLAMIKDQFGATLGWGNLRAHKGLFTVASFWQACNLMTHVLTLYVIAIALGSPIPFVACLIAFTFSKFLSMISIVPGAPGVFEGAMTLVLLAFGISADIALASTILTRAFTFWLPMPIGWLLYGHYMKKFEEADKEEQK